jgi:hypothetical protein
VYYGHGLSTSSTTSNSIGTGSKTFTVPLSLKISANQVMKITDSSNSSNYMIGTVSSYAPASGTLVFSSGSISGSGTITNWTITVYPFGVNSIGYTNLTAFQATGFDANSIETDPQLVDAANNVFYPKAAFSNGSIIGAYPYSFVRGAGHNPDSSWDVSSTPNNTPAIWYNPGGNIAKNITTGFFELISGTSGVLYSPVYDVGSIQTITRINLGSNQVWPNAMIDTTTSDFAPNYQTIEIRASNSTFLQDASSPSWVEKKSDSTFTGISGRYVQIRLTFRTDDVGA